MYAVIKTGGKQHKVSAGDLIKVELLEGSPGDKVTFEPILVVDDDGTTHFGKEASKAKVTGTLAGEKKNDKIQVFKYKAKTGYSRKTGHRQTMTLIEIEDVSLGGAPKKAAAAKPKAEPKAAPKSESKAEAKTGAGEKAAE